MPNQLNPQETEVIIAILKGQHKAGKIAVPWKQIRENGYLPKGLSCDDARATWYQISKKLGLLETGEHVVPKTAANKAWQGPRKQSIQEIIYDELNDANAGVRDAKLFYKINRY